jgi:hypothetical protein
MVAVAIAEVFRCLEKEASHCEGASSAPVAIPNVTDPANFRSPQGEVLLNLRDRHAAA